MKPALIVIDMLEEFVHGRLKSPDAEKIVPNIKKLIDTARNNGIPVIYVADRHFPVDHELKLWGEHALINSEESRIIKELEPTSRDYVLYKRSYSGFRDTGLDMLLRDLGIDTVFLTGIHTHICVLHTAWDAFYYGYNIYVVKDAVAAFSREDHEYALKYMEKNYGAKIVDTKEALKLLGSKA
ncbi:cysteine hydrolase family protein [Staphylothermus hellenicus]|uniref:Isochorismatase hydrolase n=1 Tax=Staphylothermus hellenicus (strain DSM 12710 / JCM 10830 / BK20S6-10-b1 / P8) TaxID=591019 RepID=D7DB84_STAHD|nr:isochorismatase family cysteine hydrolase [Staphylothermus hellenicus]ADI31431.1 isochorismatase hydrolase [Staphylothermus hellenicus DSM 12710]